jgi:hypothetical protein
MRRREKPQLLGVIGLVLVCGVPAQAGTLSGTVVDPQQRVITSASVSLICGNRTDTQNTDSQGYFAFIRQAFPESCRIRAAYPGFAALEQSVGQRRVLTLQLELSEVKQMVAVKDDILSPTSLASTSVSGDDLRVISDNENDLVAYAKLLAGVQSGSDHIYVDGLPTDHLPPAGRIETITINANPFSAEYSDGSNTHIDVVTKNAERKFRLDTGGVSLGTSARNGLDSRLSSASNTVGVGLMGPVPYLPLAFTSDVYFTDRHREEPIEAIIPPVQGFPIVTVAGVPARDSNTLLRLGAEYSKNDSSHVNASLYNGMARNSNMNVSGLTLPEAGVGKNATAREFRVTLRMTGRNYVYRGGIVTDWSSTDSRANSSSLGISVSGAFIAGGADISRQSIQKTRWTVKNVVEFSAGKHYWSAGSTISRMGDDETTIPNPFGGIHFETLDQYIQSATAGAHTGIGLITRGQGQARYSSYAAAPFVEAEILRRGWVSVRGGLRADYQTAGGMRLSPRVSVAAVLGGFVLKAGSGMFVQNWASNIFLRVMENDGHHLQQFLVPNASLADVEGGTATLVSHIVSEIAPNLAPARDWVCKFSVEHPLGRFAPGIEYTWTDGTHLLGSQRLSAPTGWTDVLESNRTLRKQQFHLRTQLSIKGQSITAHYEWIDARDDTDGPFSFPAKQGDIRGEWAPASGISPHNFTVVGNMKFRNVISLALVEVMRSPASLNITSGADVQENGLYTDRAGAPRNSGRGPAYNSLELHAHRRIPLPRLFPEFKQKTYLDVGVHAENLLGNKNYVSLGTVIGSPLLGRPLAALPGRSIRFSFSFQR